MEIFQFITFVGGIMFGMGILLFILVACLAYLFRDF